MSFNSSGILALSMLWACGLLGAFFALPLALRQRGEQLVERHPLCLILVISLAVRLIPNFLLPVGAGYDIESYRIVGNLVLRGDDIYASPETVNRHPYLPLQMYWLGLALWVARITGISFVGIVRLAPIAADAGIAGLLFLCLQRSISLGDAFRGGLSYALNPIAVFVSAYHGQFDAIPALFTLLAVIMLGRSPGLAGVCLGLGILDKSWPVLAFPSLGAALKGWRRRLWYAGGVVFVPIVGLGIYLLLFEGQVWTVLGRALGYNWGVGVWGYSYFLRLLSILKPGWGAPFDWLVSNGRYLTLAALGLLWLLRARKEPPAASVLTVLVAFLAVTHAFSIQYLVWVVPFAILAHDYKWLSRYTLGAFAYMLLAYTTLILDMRITYLLPWPQADWFIIMPAGLPAWLIAVGWASKRLFEERAQSVLHA